MPTKDEFNYLSAIFVRGEKSPRIRLYKVFNLDIFKKHKDLGINVHRSSRGEERTIELTEHTQLNAIINKNSMTHNYAPIVSYIDVINQINISDVIFNSLEFEIHKNDIKALIDRKVLATSTLIRSFYHKEISAFPLLINDFPNISKLVLAKSSIIF